MLQFEFGMAPRAHVLKACFLDGGVPWRGGDWGKGCGGGGHGNLWRWGLAGGSRLLGHVLRAVSFSAFSGLFRLLPGCHKARSSI